MNNLKNCTLLHGSSRENKRHNSCTLHTKKEVYMVKEEKIKAKQRIELKLFQKSLSKGIRVLFLCFLNQCVLSHFIIIICSFSQRTDFRENLTPETTSLVNRLANVWCINYLPRKFAHPFFWHILMQILRFKFKS